MTLEKPEKYQNQILDEIDDKIKFVSQMSKKQRQFINGIIRQTKPKKILEVGVSSGASSAELEFDYNGFIIFSFCFNIYY